MDLPIPYVPEYSTLEVDSTRDCVERGLAAAPEAIASDSDKEPIINVEAWPGQANSPPTKNTRTGTICGLRRKIFWILLSLSILATAVAAIVGGLLGTRSKHSDNNHGSTNGDDSAGANSTSPGQTAIPLLSTSRLAALQWKDNATHYRVYFQSKSGMIQESAWDSDGPDEWTVTNVTNVDTDIMLGTPIAAAAGWPSADKANDPVKKVFWLGQTSLVFQWEAPSNNPGNWTPSTDGNGGVTTTNNSDLAVRWEQNFETGSDTLSLFYQEKDSTSADLSTYATASTGDLRNIIAPGLSLNISKGSGLAIGSTGAENTLLLYTIDQNGFLKELGYTTDNASSFGTTGFDVKLQSSTPYTIVAQDNRALDVLTGQCVNRPLTHLLLYATADRSSLQLVSSNCTYQSSVIQNSKIQSLLKPGRSYLSLASHDDGRVYVMYDQGNGPEIEEWTVPATENDGPWTGVRSVAVGSA